MMRWLKATADGIDRINQFIGRGITCISFLMVLIVTTDVIMRYLFRISFVFVQELEWYLFAVLFLVGAGFTLLHDAHVRLDLFYQKYSPNVKAWTNLLGTIFFLLPGCYLIIVTSYKFALNSWAVWEGSPDPGGIPLRYILKSMIPFGFSLVALQGISLGIRSFAQIVGKPFDSKEELS